MAAEPGMRPAVERRTPPLALVRLINPVVRRLVARGALGRHVLVLHFHGRRTGRGYDVPVGYHVIDGTVHVLTDRPWRRNFATPTVVQVTLRGQRHSCRALLRDDPEEVAEVYGRLVERLGVRGAERRLGLRIRGHRPPTRSELVQLVVRTGLSLVRLDDPPPAV